MMSEEAKPSGSTEQRSCPLSFPWRHPVSPVCFWLLQLCVIWKSPDPEPRELSWVYHWMALQQTLVLGQPALWGAVTQGFPGEISGQSQACPRQARPAGPIGVLTQATYTLSPACFGEGRTLHVGSPPGACVPGER